VGLGRPGGLGLELRTHRRRRAGRPECRGWPADEGEKGRRAHTVGCGGGEGIVRLDFDFGAREAMGRGCGCVGAGRAACSHGWRPTASRQGLFGLISTLKNQAKFRSHFFYKKMSNIFLA